MEQLVGGEIVVPLVQLEILGELDHLEIKDLLEQLGLLDQEEILDRLV